MSYDATLHTTAQDTTETLHDTEDSANEYSKPENVNLCQESAEGNYDDKSDMVW